MKSFLLLFIISLSSNAMAYMDLDDLAKRMVLGSSSHAQRMAYGSLFHTGTQPNWSLEIACSGELTVGWETSQRGVDYNKCMRGTYKFILKSLGINDHGIPYKDALVVKGGDIYLEQETLRLAELAYEAILDSYNQKQRQAGLKPFHYRANEEFRNASVVVIETYKRERHRALKFEEQFVEDSIEAAAESGVVQFETLDF